MPRRRRWSRRIAGAGPATRYAGGNLLVQQMRSAIGRTPRQLDTLESLKLGRIGRSAICDISYESVRRQLLVVDFLVSVTPLSLDAVSFAPDQPTGAALRCERRKGQTWFVGEDDGYAFHEAQPENCQLLMWSSSLPVATALERVERVGWLATERKAALISDGRSRREESAQAWIELKEGGGSVDFAALELNHAELLWSRASYPHHVDEGIWPGRIGVRFDEDLRREALLDVIRRTAVPEIGREADRIVDSVLGKR